MSVWNDVRNAADCPDVDEYRQEPRGAEDHGHEGGREQEEEGEAPDVQAKCPATFGNSDIFGASIADPSAP